MTKTGTTDGATTSTYGYDESTLDPRVPSMVRNLLDTFWNILDRIPSENRAELRDSIESVGFPTDMFHQHFTRSGRPKAQTKRTIEQVLGRHLVVATEIAAKGPVALPELVPDLVARMKTVDWWADKTNLLALVAPGLVHHLSGGAVSEPVAAAPAPGKPVVTEAQILDAIAHLSHADLDFGDESCHRILLAAAKKLYRSEKATDREARLEAIKGINRALEYHRKMA